MKTQKHYYLYSELVPEGLSDTEDQGKWLEKNLRTLERRQKKPYAENKKGEQTTENGNTKTNTTS